MLKQVNTYLTAHAFSITLSQTRPKTNRHKTGLMRLNTDSWYNIKVHPHPASQIETRTSFRNSDASEIRLRKEHKHDLFTLWVKGS